MIRYIFLTFILCCYASLSFSQYGSVGFGFRAGINYSKFDGPSELFNDTLSVETFKNSSGFHIGALVNYKFTDLVGLRAELVYTQRGTKYEYNGPSYFTLGKNTLQNVTLQGTRNQTLKVTNAYLDIPVEAYYKLGKVEIFGGINMGLLVASTGGGSITFNGIAPTTHNPVDPFEVSLAHNYKTDAAGSASIETQQVSVDGRNYTVPLSVGAYYDFPTKDKQLYKTLDFGVVGGLSFFVNEGLFLSARYIYGLGDVDRNEYDISLLSLQPNGNYVARTDKNRSQSWQISVGFSF